MEDISGSFYWASTLNIHLCCIHLEVPCHTYINTHTQPNTHSHSTCWRLRSPQSSPLVFPALSSHCWRPKSQGCSWCDCFTAQPHSCSTSSCQSQFLDSASQCPVFSTVTLPLALALKQITFRSPRLRQPFPMGPPSFLCSCPSHASQGSCGEFLKWNLDLC